MPETPTSRVEREAKPVSAAVPTTVLLAAVVVAALYFGREVLVPIALAVLLSFVLAPLVRFLQGWYVPRSLAVITVVLIAFAVILGRARLVVSQVNQLASDLPQIPIDAARKDSSLARRGGGHRHAGARLRSAPGASQGNRQIRKRRAVCPRRCGERRLPDPADSRRGQAAGSRSVANPRGPDHAAHSAAHDHRRSWSSSLSSSFCNGRICETGWSGSPARRTCSARRLRSTMPVNG